MTHESNIPGNENVVIQGVSGSNITVLIGSGETLEIQRKLEALQALLEKKQTQFIQIDGRIVDINQITPANFELTVGQSMHDNPLPRELAQNLITSENIWVQSLHQELLKQGVPVGTKPSSIFQYYGWLIEAFLQKMGTPAGRERSPRRLAFMAEAYKSTLRYLCCIQVSQLLAKQKTGSMPLISAFVQSDAGAYTSYDYLNLLLLATEQIPKETAFMPEIQQFVDELANGHSDLYGVALFLEKHRRGLLSNPTLAGEEIETLLDEYLAG